jgi:pyruvate/2-oxoglutarate dehydrogenase complex dihydrolipoamide acyltransferase (E2) component
MPHITPAAEELIEAEGINPSEIQGSGAGGNILKSDVEAYLAGNGKAPEEDAEPVPVPVPVPPMVESTEDEEAAIIELVVLPASIIPDLRFRLGDDLAQLDQFERGAFTLRVINKDFFAPTIVEPEAAPQEVEPTKIPVHEPSDDGDSWVEVSE